MRHKSKCQYTEFVDVNSSFKISMFIKTESMNFSLKKMATPRFPDLWVIVEKLLLLLLGQVSLKRGFSINRNIEEKNLKVESFIPQRHICDFVYSVVGLFNVNIDKLLKGCVHYIFASLFCMSKTEHL